MKSLSSFPAKSSAAFNPDFYCIDVRKQIAAESEYTGDVGLELELEGTGLPREIRYTAPCGARWIVHDDGSLRGGLEYVTSKPVSRDTVKPMVDALFAEISEAGGRIILSNRCSTHVHVNMRQLKLHQLCAFVSLYGCFEDALTTWCEPVRHGNLFALRMSDSSYCVDRWISAFKEGAFDWSNDQRYLALNPAALRKFGSLEIRTLEGVTSSDKVVKWVDALLRIRSRAVAVENPESLAQDLSALGGDGLFANVFEGLEIESEVRSSTIAHDEVLESLVRSGFRRVQPILYALPWDSVLPEINKVFIPNPFRPEPKKSPRLRIEPA